jgi:signal transduction histidine kinase
MLKQDEPIPFWKTSAAPAWRCTAIDSLLAITGVALVTGVIAVVHLYPRLPSIVLTYLLVIIALASRRGSYAGILAAFLASFSFDFFFTVPLYQFSFTDLSIEDLLDPWIFMATGILVSLLTSTLRRHVEQARHREQEAHLLSQQAQELAALRERQRLARELHDSVSQDLYGVNLAVRAAREALNRDPREAIAPLEYVSAQAEAGLAEMRALIFELRPESLVTEGLVAALFGQVAVLRTRYKLTVDAQLGEEPDLLMEEKQSLYRIAQEALHNIIKHAHASTVRLRLAQEGRELILEIHDDGKGFDPVGPFPGHFGLQSLRERATQLGGTCSIESNPSQGTHLRVCIPILD